ncbi:hypothetical protein FBU59_003159 [Linderina macrospora]|uniref:Uncharacterized protein n=1 Tax=Linderina macrospora TaxID=4868 RepID=A0ACC1J983_9FUNG|nr:hypothetical protein FBU59_003159 [Linderina macrospora]
MQLKVYLAAGLAAFTTLAMAATHAAGSDAGSLADGIKVGGKPAAADKPVTPAAAALPAPPSKYAKGDSKANVGKKTLGDSPSVHDAASPGLGKKSKRRAFRSVSSAFDPNTVDIDIKSTWCNDNTNFCNNVCLNMTWGSPINDGCEATNLQWHCTCGNGKNPDPDVYTFPVMHYMCQYEVHQCQDNCSTGDIRCTQECQGDRNCTAPKDPNAGKTMAPETDGEEGLDSMTGNGMATGGPNFFGAATLTSAGGYVFITAIVASSLHLMGLP